MKKLRQFVLDVLLVGLALGTASCTAEVDDLSGADPTEADAAIIGGKVDAGHHAVARLLTYYGGTTSSHRPCTATLIAPTVLLTAAHCFDVQDPRPRALFETKHGNVWIDVVQIHQHPLWNRNYLEGHDVGIGILARPAPVAPMAYDRQALSASVVGKSVELVGYGLDENGDDGVKRRGFAPITSLGPQLLGTGNERGTFCHGDSGGPALRRTAGVETVIGVASFDTTGNCDRGGYHVRVDTHLDFIDRFARAQP